MHHLKYLATMWVQCVAATVLFWALFILTIGGVLAILGVST